MEMYLLINICIVTKALYLPRESRKFKSRYPYLEN